MLRASLRGLLRPDYRYGVQSYIGETLILRALIREDEGDALMHRSLLEGMLLPVAQAATAKRQIYQNAMSLMLRGQALKEMHTLKRVKKIDLRDSDKQQIKEMATSLKILKATNFYERMASILNEQ